MRRKRNEEVGRQATGGLGSWITADSHAMVAGRAVEAGGMPFNIDDAAEIIRRMVPAVEAAFPGEDRADA